MNRKKLVATVATLALLFLFGTTLTQKLELDIEKQNQQSLAEFSKKNIPKPKICDFDAKDSTNSCEVEKSSATLNLEISSDSLKTPKQIYREANYAVKVDVWEFSKSTTSNIMVPDYGWGSGSVIKCDKYTYCVLTANHVAETNQDTFFVHFKDGTPPQKIELIGGSDSYDFSILKFSDPNFKPNATAILGKSSSLEAGERIVAIGSGRFGDFWFSAEGYLYAPAGVPNPMLKQRLDEIDAHYPKVLEISTNLFAGYSGGPLINEKGEVIGIGVAGVGLDGKPIGIGIPIDEIMKEIDKILNNEKK